MNSIPDFHYGIFFLFCKDEETNSIYDIFDFRAYINSYLLFGHFNCNYNSFDNFISLLIDISNIDDDTCI